MTFGSLGFIFPGAVLLDRHFGSPKPGGISACSSFDFDLAGGILLALTLLTLAWPLAFRKLNSALYFMAWAFPWATTIGLWFYLAGMGIVLCTPLPYPEPMLWSANSLFATLAAAIFWFYLRPRLPLAIEQNTPKWDFDRMEYSLFASAISPQALARMKPGAVKRAVVMAFGASVGALLLLRWILDVLLTRYMPLSAARGWEGTVLAIGISYGLFLLVPGQAYAMYIVYRKCAAIGGRMRIKEYSQ